jgi:threonyl-tRNA synthetase
VEHYAGAFPTWLAPVQALVLPIGEHQHDYAVKVTERLKAAGLRADVDLRNEKAGYKIREAEKAKIPYMLVVGAREQQAESVSIRKRGGEDKGSQPVLAAIDLIRADLSQALS